MVVDDFLYCVYLVSVFRYVYALLCSAMPCRFENSSPLSHDHTLRTHLIPTRASCGKSFPHTSGPASSPSPGASSPPAKPPPQTGPAKCPSASSSAPLKPVSARESPICYPSSTFATNSGFAWGSFSPLRHSQALFPVP